ncbi:MAG: SDR family oxidoreductase, partial [Halobacteria archaeon]|nr:SDR family oxidoreductase [Halobacteria archaeon]
TESLIDETVEEFGAVHSIANFAGILRDRMIFNMSEEDWDTVINVHLKGHFSLLRNAAEHWRERYKDGDDAGFDDDVQRSFLCVSSGVAAGNPGQANYSAAKAGILGLMRTSARELLQYDVRVNALWPSAVTRMTEDLPVMQSVSEDEMGPQFVPGAPVFLASEEARDIAGCTLGIAGGNLSFVTDPKRESSLNKDVEEGAWTPEEIAENWDELTDGFETTRMNPGW